MKCRNKVAVLLVAALVTCGVVLALDGQFVDVRPIPGSGLNSTSGEWSPSVTEDGRLLLFASARDGLWRLYLASRDATKQPFNFPRRLDEIHAQFDPGLNVGAGHVSADGLKVCFSVWSESVLSDIYCATRKDRSVFFGPAGALTNINSSRSEDGGVTFTADEETIVFFRNPDGGPGSFDLFEAWWSEPDGRYLVRDLEEINQDGFGESDAGISRAGLTLFFGQRTFPLLPGSDGADIWVSTRATRTSAFGEPQLLGPPVNSSAHDMSPQPSYDWPRDGSKLYFVRPVDGSDIDLFEATWRSAFCPPYLRGERVNDVDVRLTWANGEIAPAKVDVFRDGELIADDAPADPREYHDTPPTLGVHAYRVEFDVPGEDCIDLTTEVDNRPPCDTHCTGITAELIDMPGVNVGVTVDAHDDSGGQITYSLVATSSGLPRQTAGPQPQNEFKLGLEPGEWRIRATVSGDSACTPPAFDHQCRTTIDVPPPAPIFIRGDANADGDTNIADPIYILNHLFGGGATPPCRQSADANDDTAVDIADPVYVLNHLFGGGPPPPPPVGECGTDPTPAENAADDLGCEAFEAC